MFTGTYDLSSLLVNDEEKEKRQRGHHAENELDQGLAGIRFLHCFLHLFYFFDGLMKILKL